MGFKLVEVTGRVAPSLDVSPPGRFAPWTFRHLDVSPTRWTFRPRLWTFHVRPRLLFYVFVVFFHMDNCGSPDILETTTARKLNLKIPLDMVKYPL